MPKRHSDETMVIALTLGDKSITVKWPIPTRMAAQVLSATSRNDTHRRHLAYQRAHGHARRHRNCIGPRGRGKVHLSASCHSGHFRAQSSLLRLPTNESFAEQAAYALVREGGAARDEAGVPGRCKAETTSTRFLSRRDQHGAGKPHQPGLHRYCTE